jgi:hypothetical protein
LHPFPEGNSRAMFSSNNSPTTKPRINIHGEREFLLLPTKNPPEGGRSSKSPAVFEVSHPDLTAPQPASTLANITKTEEHDIQNDIIDSNVTRNERQNTASEFNPIPGATIRALNERLGRLYDEVDILKTSRKDSKVVEHVGKYFSYPELTN